MLLSGLSSERCFQGQVFFRGLNRLSGDRVNCRGSGGGWRTRPKDCVEALSGGHHGSERSA